MSEATLLEKLVKMGLPLDAAYTEGQFQYVIDAAIRRAKAEGLDDAAKAICMYCNDPEWQKRDEDDNHESPYTRTMYPCAAYKIHDLIRELDARAAQIEEGATK